MEYRIAYDMLYNNNKLPYIDYLNPNGQNILHLAILNNLPVDIKKLLIYKGVDVNMCNVDGQTALHLELMLQRCDDNSYQSVKTFIASNANTNIIDKYGNAALHYACTYSVVELLVKNGANPNIQNKSGNTLLHNICLYDHSIVKLLIEYGADPNIKNNAGLTVLNIIASCESESITDTIDLVIKAGATDVYEVYEATKNRLLERIINQRKIKNGRRKL